MYFWEEASHILLSKKSTIISLLLSSFHQSMPVIRCLTKGILSQPGYGINLPKRNRMTLKLKTIRKSRKAEKKFDAVFDKDGKEKIVSFGAAGMSNYTKHKNATRKQRYLKRHTGKGEKWQQPDTPGALSRWVLWNKPSFRESVADFRRRFNL